MDTIKHCIICSLRAVLMLFVAIPAQAGGTGETLADFEPELSDEFVTLLQQANPEDGEVVFMRKCSSCHEHEKTGVHWKGPRLWNLFGRKAGSESGFVYSDAMRNSGHTWGFETLNYYLTRTDRAVPGRAMNFRGIKSDKSRAKLIAFLRTLNDDPPALPE